MPLNTAICGLWSSAGETDDGDRIAVPLRCRRWHCPHCGPFLKEHLIRRIASEDVNALLTLTCNPASFSSPEAAYPALTTAINRLFKRVRRLVSPAPVEYLLVWEVTQKGWPHAHVILRAPFIHQRWLSQAWQELTGAFIVDIRGIHAHRKAMEYVAKYLAKDPIVPKGYKRYRCSRHFFTYPDSKPDTLLKGLHNVHVIPVSTAQLAEEWRRLGLTVQEWSDGVVTATKGVFPLSLPLSPGPAP